MSPMYELISSALAEFPGCTDTGGPELGMTLRNQSLAEWLEVSVSTWEALCQMPREQAQRREEQYMPRKKVPDEMERPQSCGDTCELDPEVHTSRMP